MTAWYEIKQFADRYLASIGRFSSSPFNPEVNKTGQCVVKIEETDDNDNVIALHKVNYILGADIMDNPKWIFKNIDTSPNHLRII